MQDLSIGRALEAYGEHDWHDLEVTIPYATGLVVDVGANIGTHSLVYAKTATQVLAFEPQFMVYKLLVMNTVLNNADNIMPYWCALGEEDGMIRIPAYAPDCEAFYGGVDVGEGEDIVIVRKLDSLNIGKVSLLKVDAERSILAVLRGARETILRDRPVMYLECCFGDEVNREICTLVEELGYTWERHIVPAYPEDNFYCNAENMYQPGTHNENILCFPK